MNRNYDAPVVIAVFAFGLGDAGELSLAMSCFKVFRSVGLGLGA